MSTPIEGFEENTTIDRRTKAYREAVRQNPRQDVRPDTRPDSIREAEEYANKILDQFGDASDYDDKFYVDPATIPLGWTFMWRTYSVFGKENAQYMNARARSGWRPVQSDRYPEFMPAGYAGPIIVDGLMLMEQPTILVERALAATNKESKDALRNADRRLADAPPNTAPRDVGAQLRGDRLGKDWDHVPVKTVRED